MIRRAPVASVAAAALAAAVSGGCTKTDTVSVVQAGAEAFASPQLSTDPENRFSCATCHYATASAPDARLYVGGSLHDVTARPRTWGGQELRLLDSVNFCYQQFMAGVPFAADDPKGEELYAYLRSVSPDPTAPQVPWTVVKQIDIAIPDGDPARGQTTYAESCQLCHGAIHTGAGRLTAIATIIPDETVAAHGTDPNTGARPVTIEKIRHGKFYGIGGRMPPFGVETLSDAQIGDILAYLGY